MLFECERESNNNFAIRELNLIKSSAAAWRYSLSSCGIHPCKGDNCPVTSAALALVPLI